MNIIFSRFVSKFKKVRRLIPIRSFKKIHINSWNNFRHKIFSFKLFILSITKGAAHIVYIGDSHSYSFTLPFEPTNDKINKLIKINNTEHLYWLGPRLLYSVIKKGISTDLIAILNCFRIKKKQIILVWFLGEIDISVFGKQRYLNSNENIDNLIRNYVEYLNSNFFNFKNIIVIPTKPSDIGFNNPSYPRDGTLEERIIVFKLFEKAIKNQKSIQYFDQNKFIIKDYLSKDETNDGTHFDFKYSLKIRNELIKEIFNASN